MSAKQLISIIVILLVLSLGGWAVAVFIPQTIIPENTVVVTQQASSLEKKLQELLTGGHNTRLQEFQKTLKSFVALPLPNRQGGKDNPFLPVTAPVDQFSHPAGSAVPVNKTITNRK